MESAWRWICGRSPGGRLETESLCTYRVRRGRGRPNRDHAHFGGVHARRRLQCKGPALAQHALVFVVRTGVRVNRRGDCHRGEQDGCCQQCPSDLHGIQHSTHARSASPRAEAVAVHSIMAPPPHRCQSRGPGWTLHPGARSWWAPGEPGSGCNTSSFTRMRTCECGIMSRSYWCRAPRPIGCNGSVIKASGCCEAREV